MDYSYYPRPEEGSDDWKNNRSTLRAFIEQAPGSVLPAARFERRCHSRCTCPGELRSHGDGLIIALTRLRMSQAQAHRPTEAGRNTAAPLLLVGALGPAERVSYIVTLVAPAGDHESIRCPQMVYIGSGGTSAWGMTLNRSGADLRIPDPTLMGNGNFTTLL